MGEELKSKVWKWFDSQYCELERDSKQNIAKMLGDWIYLEKGKFNSMYIGTAMNLLKRQKQRTEEKFIRDGWQCGAEFTPTLEYYPFHAEETDNLLALCWVRHIVKTEGE